MRVGGRRVLERVRPPELAVKGLFPDQFVQPLERLAGGLVDDLATRRVSGAHEPLNLAIAREPQ